MTASIDSPGYVPLHVHSYYSFLSGTASPAELAQMAAAQGLPALALTDRQGLTSAVEFYLACQESGIQPILGLELVCNHQLGRGDLVLLAMDLAGWRSLCHLSSILQNHPSRDPERGLAFEQLAAENSGLICLSGGSSSLLQQLLESDELSAAQEWLAALRSIFLDRLYVQYHNPQATPALNALAQAQNLPGVVAPTVYYLHPTQAQLQRTLSAMRLNLRLTELPSNATAPREAHFAPPAETAERFATYPAALANSFEIAQRCQLQLPIGQPHYPIIPLPAGETPSQRLRSLAESGAIGRYGRITPTIQDRLDHELAVIAARGYDPLFLIMQEILGFARQQGIPISSRGSAASSLVAYCLGLTTPDPLALDLYFERFLNPARATPPDIDTDLCSERRDEVLQHVYEQYGQEHVAMVATINRFRPRSALREVAKAHGLSGREITSLVEGIPSRGWGPPSRRYDRQKPYGNLETRYPDPRVRAVLREAEAIIGFPRHLSVHPGGIVIAPGPMTDLAPTHLASKGLVITQFDLKSIEHLGLVKIDLLGTRGLTVLGEVAGKVYNWHRAEYRNSLGVLESIPAKDRETATLVRTAATIGCFQIESPGMRATLKEIEAQSPEDLMIALALYRPGPMTGGLKSSFVRRHLGQEPVEHLHPALSHLLANTHGVILYQEQVLLIASQLAGLSLADADLLRRAMSHFDPGEQMRTLKMRFMRGAEEKNAVPPETAERIWDLMAAFAGYGFPKAHAASYAQISWRSAWCKAHYPAEFMAAVLAGWGGYYRQRVYLNEARRLGLRVCPPQINHAQRQFCVSYPAGEATLYMGLDQVRDLTRRTQQRIMQQRPFHSIEDFLRKVDPRPQEAENLARVGALSGLGSIPALLRRIKLGGWAYGQLSLFAPEIEASEVDWNLAQRVEAQLSILGASVDAHPLELAAAEVAASGAISTLEALTQPESEVRVAGVRQTAQRFFAHEGDPFYILELEDLEGVLPVLMTPGFYQQHRRLMASNTPFIVEGKITQSPTTSEPVLQARRLLPL